MHWMLQSSILQQEMSKDGMEKSQVRNTSSTAYENLAENVRRRYCRNSSAFAAKHDMSELSDELKALGFSSPAHFSQILGEFIEGHSWALKSCAKAHVLQEGGIEWTQNPEKMLYFCLVPCTFLGLPSYRNPSRAFKIKAHAFVTLEEQFARVPSTVDDWIRWAPNREATRTMYALHPMFAGILPVMFDVEGVNMTQLVYYPLFRSEHPRPEQWIVDCMLEDMVELCVASINRNFPLRSNIEGNSPLIALPGRFVYTDSTWTWRQFFSDWSRYRPGAFKELDETLARLKIPDMLEELMMLFRAL